MKSFNKMIRYRSIRFEQCQRGDVTFRQKRQVLRRFRLEPNVYSRLKGVNESLIAENFVNKKHLVFVK